MTSEPQLFTVLTTGKPAREITACNRKGPFAAWAAGWQFKPRCRPCCNRVRYHMGPHREYSRLDATIRAEWT